MTTRRCRVQGKDPKEADRQLEETICSDRDGPTSSRAEGAGGTDEMEARSERLLLQKDDFQPMIEPAADRLGKPMARTGSATSCSTKVFQEKHRGIFQTY